MEVYKTDPLRYHRSLVIYLNELSLSDQTSQVSFPSPFDRNTYIQLLLLFYKHIRFVWR